MVQQLTAMAALLKNLDRIASTHMLAHIFCNYNPKGLAASSGTAHTWYTDKYADKTLIHIK